MLNAIRAGGVPFNEVFIKVWTCISEPESVDAQKYLNEKAIGEIVTSLKEKGNQRPPGAVNKDSIFHYASFLGL